MGNNFTFFFKNTALQTKYFSVKFDLCSKGRGRQNVGSNPDRDRGACVPEQDTLP